MPVQVSIATLATARPQAGNQMARRIPGAASTPVAPTPRASTTVRPNSAGRVSASGRTPPRSSGSRYWSRRCLRGVLLARYSALLADSYNRGVPGLCDLLPQPPGNPSSVARLPCPRMFMYGEQNSSLSYLTKLGANGVELAEIPHSAHWPVYSNPAAMWETHRLVPRPQHAGLTVRRDNHGRDGVASISARPFLQQLPGRGAQRVPDSWAQPGRSGGRRGRHHQGRRIQDHHCSTRRMTIRSRQHGSPSALGVPTRTAGRIGEAPTRVLLPWFRGGLGVASEPGTRPDPRFGRRRFRLSCHRLAGRVPVLAPAGAAGVIRPVLAEAGVHGSGGQRVRAIPQP